LLWDILCLELCVCFLHDAELLTQISDLHCLSAYFSLCTFMLITVSFVFALSHPQHTDAKCQHQHHTNDNPKSVVCFCDFFSYLSACLGGSFNDISD